MDRRAGLRMLKEHAGSWRDGKRGRSEVRNRLMEIGLLLWRSACRQDWWRLDRLAKVLKDTLDSIALGYEGNYLDLL